jgi:hypothetical protein
MYNMFFKQIKYENVYMTTEATFLPSTPITENRPPDPILCKCPHLSEGMLDDLAFSATETATALYKCRWLWCGTWG